MGSKATQASSDHRALARELLDELERVLDKAEALLTALIDEQGCASHDGQPQQCDGVPGSEPQC
jgi:hypothetical protein